MRAQDYVGKHFHHKTHGSMFVDELPERSRTFVEATVTDRGTGWEPRTQSYKGITTTTKGPIGEITASTWTRGENREFGNRYLVHINDLMLIEDE